VIILVKIHTLALLGDNTYASGSCENTGCWNKRPQKEKGDKKVTAERFHGHLLLAITN
jgi:hypothetical protein